MKIEGTSYDKELEEALMRYGFNEKFRLCVADGLLKADEAGSLAHFIEK